MPPGLWQVGQPGRQRQFRQGPLTQGPLSGLRVLGPQGEVRRAGQASFREHRARRALGEPASPPCGHYLAPPSAPANHAPGATVAGCRASWAGPKEPPGLIPLTANTRGQTNEVSLGAGREPREGLGYRQAPERCTCPAHLPGLAPRRASFSCLPEPRRRWGNLARSQTELPRRPLESTLLGAGGRGLVRGWLCSRLPCSDPRLLPHPQTASLVSPLLHKGGRRLRDCHPLPQTTWPWGQWPAL